MAIHPSVATLTLRTEDFTASCPSGTHVVWRELDWQASIPATASIVFSVQTANPTKDGGAPSYSGVTSVPVGTATTSTVLPGFDVAYIDTPPSGGAFQKASPPIASANALRLTVTLNPTSTQSAPPTLIQWSIKSDCPPSE